MALVYDLVFAADFKSLDIVCGTLTTSITIGNAPVESNTNLNNELVSEIAELPLFKKEGVTITFGDVYKKNYNSVELYKNDWINNSNIKLTGRQLFETLKFNVSKLYALVKDDSKFTQAIKTYLQPVPNTGNLDNGNYFPYLLAKRHMLFKIATLLYISFTVAEKTMCDTEESQELDFKKAKQQYDSLLKLLGDTTNLLLNIDVLNQTPTPRNASNSRSPEPVENYNTPTNSRFNVQHNEEDDVTLPTPPFPETNIRNV